MSDDSAMEEGRLEERMPMRYWCGTHHRLAQDANGCDPNLGGITMPCKTVRGPWVGDDRDEIDRLRAENDALKQQLQELREPEAS